MPFLDHLEELRWRILWSLFALVVGAVIGFFLVQRFDVLGLLKDPIAPYLPEGKLFVTRPTDAFIITLKLAVVVGAVLASPVIIAQVWRFLSPALYEHERRYIVPALIAGLGLFGAGVLMAYLWVLPAVFRILSGFQYEYLEWIITADAYFGFATKMILAFGLMFELPVLMVLLSALDLIRPQTFARHRPIALVIGAILAALLTPPDVLSMLMMMAPVLLLYEAGIIAARLVGGRRSRKAIGGVSATVLLLAITPGATEGQVERPQRPPRAQRDSVAAVRDSLGQPLDTATARKLGLPSAPSRSFPQADSVIRALLERSGYAITLYAGDSITLFGETREITLVGSALVEREGTTLEAGTVSFAEANCQLLANGSPVLFDAGTVLVGEGMRYDTCEHRGGVDSALTSFVQSGVTWYLRGGLEIDSASTRIYGADNDMTSCDLTTPHYHFAAGSVKWVTNTIMVARPAVLYVRDVPILWLPFIFQDMRRGRRTGLLVPRFGFSDLVRPNEGYRRHVSNIGFYVALNDFTDFQASLDWFSGNYIGINGQLRYRWLDRFVAGGLSVSRIFESEVEGVPGDRSLRLQWNHQQAFNIKTRLTASVDFATSSRVVQRNAVDPFVQTATLASRINFNKQFAWGTLAIGGNRTQDLSNGSTSQTLPSVSLTPSPINLGQSITWSPAVTFNNARTFDQAPGVVVPLPPVGDQLREDTILTDSRTTNLQFRTPLRIGRWNWVNDISVTDFRTNRPPPPIVLADPADPTDSVTRFYGEDFRTGVDWNTGINLPSIFPSTWKLQPSIGIRNTTGGPFLLRNRFSGGKFVSQGKRLSFAASLTPTFFGFFPGVGPVSRIRHAVSPLLSWSYAPAAEVPEAYARALNPTSQDAQRRSPPVHRISLALSQTFEGKLRPPPGDTVTDPQQARKVKLLSIQTSAIEFDFEQAKEEGRNGWRTQAITNRFTSDLLPGFSLGTTHDLWDGPVGFDTTTAGDTVRFDPFLTSVSARFSVSANTFKRILALFGAGEAPPPAAEPSEPTSPEDLIQPAGTGLGPRRGLDPTIDQMAPYAPRGRGLQASFTYDDQRTRPVADTADTRLRPTNNRTLGFTLSFSPTRNWSVSWNTQYNLTRKEFGQHVLRFDRDLHRWRATFSFVRAPNGNFAFNFFISLLDQPEIKFQYDQRTVRQGSI